MKDLLKIDFKNAFDSVERDVMLSEIKKHTPKMYGNVIQNLHTYSMEKT